MGYSVHIPLGLGDLIIKSESRLRQSERNGEVRVLKIGKSYYVWRPRGTDQRPPPQTGRVQKSAD